MWLDRFSGNATPSNPSSPHARSFSPAPRRPSHLGPGTASRPGFSPRSSSLNIAKFNSSITSLNSQRLVNGSGLKQEISPPVDLVDPLKVLEELLETSIGQSNGEEEHDKSRADLGEKPAELLADIPFNGLGLHSFLQEEEKENGNGSLESDSKQSIEEYEKDKDKFEDLHRSILACDDVLKSVEVSLTNFQNDLGAVSAEIETLQSRSTELNTRLENRKVVEKLLGPALEEVSISPVVVKTISEGPIDHGWAKALEELERRSRTIDSKLKGPDTVLAVSDIKPLLDDLTNLAVERIRDFFVSQIKALRSPNINAQIIQQRAFLVYKDLYAFLARHHAQLAEEIGQAYINTMRWYYLNSFTRYRLALDKLPLYNVERHDVLGADPVSQKGTLLGGSKAPQPAHDALSLGRRIDVLKRSSSSAIPSHVAEESKIPTYLEAPFHAFNTALIDNASFEYSFLTTFFPNVSFQTLSRYFNSIFSPTFALGHAITKQLIDTTCDCLGLLLCVRLIQHLAFELQRRKCPVVDSYINGTNMLLWPRFQVAMDMHVESVRRSTAALSGGARATLSLTSSNTDSKASTAPHVLTQRFGQFLQGILALSGYEVTASGSGETAGNDSEPVVRSLERLRGEINTFLIKAAKSLPQAKRNRFLGNNYSLILTIVGDTGGNLASEMRDWFEQLRENVGGD